MGIGILGEGVSLDGAEREDEEGCVGNEDVNDFTLLLVDTDDGEGEVGLHAVMPPAPPPPPACPAELLGAPGITLKLL